jgi:hypothetical protein
VAASPQGDPGAGAAPQGAPAPAQGAPSQGAANPKQQMLAQLYMLCKKMAQEDPTLSAGMQKAAEGIQEAQAAMVSQPQPTPQASQPQY